MSNTINESNYSAYNTHRNQGASGGDNITKYVQKLFSKNGISGNVELNRDTEGRISVMNDHPQKEEIESLLNNDEKLSSLLARQKPASSNEQDAGQDKQGVYHENADGDSVFISDVAIQSMTRHKSNYLDTIDKGDIKNLEEYMPSAFTNDGTGQKLVEANREYELKINYMNFSSGNHKYTSGFKRSKTGMMWFEHGAGMNMPIRKGTTSIEPGKYSAPQERDVLNSASDSRKKVYSQLNSAMKQAGIEIKQGQKVDFVMDEKGNVIVNPDSVKDKNLASRIQAVINDDKKLGGSFMDLLSKSSASMDSDPASMRMHVDSILREYTGKGFDDMEWDSSGSLIPPDGYEEAWEEFAGLSYMVGHLKYLQETEGDDIFKKEFSFSVTASGIIDDNMKLRAGSNLFNSDKMLFDRSYYSEDSTSRDTLKIVLQPSEDRISDFWKMKSLEDMITSKSTTVYMATDSGSSFAVDTNGNRQQLPYQSENHDATAKYLIENYFIENGIEGNVSDYALKINNKGSYEVVRLPQPDVSKIK